MGRDAEVPPRHPARRRHGGILHGGRAGARAETEKAAAAAGRVANRGEVLVESVLEFGGQ